MSDNQKGVWTKEEDETVLGDEPLKTIAEKLGRSTDAVRQRRFKLREATGANPKSGESYEQGDDFINIICASKRIMSQDEIIEQFKVDMTTWEVDRFRVKTSEGYRKDRSVIWKVQDGNVIKGDVNDTGKMLVVPLYHIELRLIKRKGIEDTKIAISQLIEDARKYHCVYPKIKYAKGGGYLYEIDLPDIHFGRLSWDDETGENYDIAIAEQMISSVIEKLIIRSNGFDIERILLPIGNDFYNVDNDSGTTTKGTPQQEDGRWQRSFRRGRELCVKIIDACSSIAPVDVLVIPGNHDSQRSFYLGDALSCWYHGSNNVSINNDPITRKYYRFGQGLIGFTHGSNIELSKLPLIMAMEQPEMWSQTKHREWHTGHKHFKKDTVYAANEGFGVMVRILRSLAVSDAWTFNGGLVGTKRSAESFLWETNEGIVAQFTATP
jgi:hypothetical protein